MVDLSRRCIVSGLAAVAIPTGAAAAPTSFSATDTPDQAVDRLWRRRTELIVEGRAITAAREAAEARMPEWARSGPAYLRGDGAFAGPHVGWPRDTAVRPPDYADMRRMCRPGPSDIAGWFARDVRNRPKERASARAAYRFHMRELVVRLRAQRDEERAVGMAGILADDEASWEQRSAIDDAIELVPPCTNGTAAMVMLETKYARLGCTVSEVVCLNILRRWRHDLSGLIREHAELLLESDPSAIIDHMPFVM